MLQLTFEQARKIAAVARSIHELEEGADRIKGGERVQTSSGMWFEIPESTLRERYRKLISEAHAELAKMGVQIVG